MRDEPLPEWAMTPHPSRCRPGAPHRQAILQRHAEAVARGDAFYRDPGTGLAVFTAQFLWERGTCCDSGCRHCPYVARPEAENG